MQRSLIALVICSGLLLIAAVPQSFGFSWGSSPLLKIDQEEFTATDFDNWWKSWREKDQPFPQTIDSYIDWLLMAREAEKMMLFDDPAYQRNINVYLRVLSQVQLKNDEIDHKVNITDEMLRDEYKRVYTPIWNYNYLVLKNKEIADALYADLLAGRITFDDLNKFIQTEGKAHGQKSTENRNELVEKLANYPDIEEQLLGVQVNAKLRPVKAGELWDEKMRGLAIGAYTPPFEWEKGFVIVQLVDKEEGDETDFNRLKVNIRLKLRKSEQGRLTIDLIERLKKKYEVSVNEERLKEMDPDSPDFKLTDEPLIRIGNLSISEKQIMDNLNKDLQTYQIYGLERGSVKKALLRIVDGTISQTLITLEALDRHYEKKSPIKDMVEFKKKHKLVQMLEEQIKGSLTAVGDDEIRSYYEKNQAEFTTPDVYKLVLLKGVEIDLKKVWLDVVVNGDDFGVSAGKRLGTQPVAQGYPVDHLEKPVFEKLATLNKGEVSQVFPLDDTFAIIYFVDFIPSTTAPLQNVKYLIEDRLLQARYEDAREKYVSDLREKASLTINEEEWTTLKAELIKEK